MLDNLEKEGYIKKLSPDFRRVQNSLSLARRDVDTAMRILDESDYDWAFNISYNSMLQSIRALMFNRGYRPSSKNSHIAVVKFTEIVLGKDYSICLDRIRRKRHRAVYDLTGTISKSEAHHVVKMAVKLLNKVENELESN
ncbi:HEPN domain-containing protein [Methanobacterium formicicum]|uniref:HEPN domain-containing protein n=1 Tax=Methanobacterium formicicum TaxID=2162 RepID=A0A090I484_METFO|nr:HEPN domain-containing protein [Methanobacterium formicicum]MDH2658981.1 HEPN domain-containing protein [Methanobacterium formicicum]CEA14143.1 hypothetical protein DSM1535_1818 [Methanobacterium formicicum]